MRVRSTTVAVEEQELLHILSVLSVAFNYPACKAHAPYYIICGPSGCTMFFHTAS